jgi:D-alanyl-D-alanine carboxypeptidase
VQDIFSLQQIKPTDMKLRKLLSLVFTASGLALQANAQLPAQLEQRLQDTLDYMQSHYQTVGVSAAVSVKGQGLWKGTAGVSEPGVPLETGMLIGIGSNTKTFVSALVLRQDELGQLSLDDTIGTWIQGYPYINGAITVKQLLNHTSGLFSYTESAAMWDSLVGNPTRVWSMGDILDHFIEPPVFNPGSDWEYSNTNYVVAGLILESVTGRPLPSLIRDSILTPLQMTRTFFPPDEIPAYASAHFWGEGGEYLLPLESYSLPNAAGALLSTPEDVVHFWEGLFNGSIISKSTLNNKMLEMAVNSPDNKYGYGLGIFKDNYFDNNGYSHGGTWLGQINSNFIDTVRGITICVLSNQDSLANAYTEAVVAALYKVFLNTTGIAGQQPGRLAATFYPNPASEVLYLQNEGYTGRRTVTLKALDGRQWLEKSFAPLEKVELSLVTLPPGIYIAEVTDDAGRKGIQKCTIAR